MWKLNQIYPIIIFELYRQRISKNLISYAKQRNIKIIAEGVETKKELENLMEFEIDYLHGYYFSKPEFIPLGISEKLVKEVLQINEKLKRN